MANVCCSRFVESEIDHMLDDTVYVLLSGEDNVDCDESLSSSYSDNEEISSSHKGKIEISDSGKRLVPI